MSMLPRWPRRRSPWGSRWPRRSTRCSHHHQTEMSDGHACMYQMRITDHLWLPMPHARKARKNENMHHTDLELSSIPQHHVACDDPIMHAQCTPPPPDPQTLTHKLTFTHTKTLMFNVSVCVCLCLFKTYCFLWLWKIGRFFIIPHTNTHTPKN